MKVDLSKANPNFKLHSSPLELHIRGKVLKTEEWTTSWIELSEGERALELQALFIKDPAKPAKKVELVLSEKDVARLYGICTEFLTETVKRANRPTQKFVIRTVLNENTPRECSIYADLPISENDKIAFPPHCDDCQCAKVPITESEYERLNKGGS